VKTLHLLRHAKSDWSGEGVADHERPLNGRGKRSRLEIAEHVKDWTVDLVVCSTARRARATAKPVVEALGCPVRYDDALYEATPGALLTVVQGLADDDASVMLVGHNPTMEELTELLCASSPEYPTAALGTIELAVDTWSEVAPGCGTLAAFVTPALLHDLP
jgi:phosphohistidine phosphatase